MALCDNYKTLFTTKHGRPWVVEQVTCVKYKYNEDGGTNEESIRGN